MLFSHQWMIREFISSKGWLKQRSFFSLSVIRLECQLHPKSTISILFANFLLPSVIMHRHQSPLLSVFAILAPLFAAVRTVSGVIEAGLVTIIYFLFTCYAAPPPLCGRVVWSPVWPNSDDNPVMAAVWGRSGGGHLVISPWWCIWERSPALFSTQLY